MVVLLFAWFLLSIVEIRRYRVIVYMYTYVYVYMYMCLIIIMLVRILFNIYDKSGKHYSQHLEHIRKYETVNLLEIGVASGGSINVWREYFGSALRWVNL